MPVSVRVRVLDNGIKCWDCPGCGVARYTTPGLKVDITGCANPACRYASLEALENVDAARHLFRGTEESLWSPFRDGFTASSMSMWLTDRVQFYFHYVKGLGGTGTPIGMAFGSCCHWVLEQAYSKEVGWVDMRTPPDRDWVLAAIKSYEGYWLSKNPAASPKQLEIQEQVYGLAEAALPPYFVRWDGDFTGTYTYGNHTARPVEWISLEGTFRETRKFEDGEEFPVQGRRDGLFFDPSRDITVLDTKCLSIVNDSDILDTMEWDLQQMMYLSVTQQEFGKCPRSMIKNVIRRPLHRQGKKESREAFFARVAADMALPEKFDHNYSRFQIRIVAKDLNWWEETQLYPIAADMRDWFEGKLRHYVNPTALIGKYGRCGMFQAVAKGDMSPYTKRTVCFPELED